MKLTYRYRAYANKETLEHVSQWLELCRRLYNVALANRIECWQEDHETVSGYDQANALPDFKIVHPEYQNVGSQVLQNVLERLDKAYKGFFRRVKAGGKAGFPRFRGRGWYDSFTLKQTGWKLEGNHLHIAKVGIFKLHLSRPIEGEIKIVTMRRSATGKWYVCFSCDSVPENKLPENDKSIGIDVGITSMAVDSEGHKIDNPRYSNKSMAELRLRQRRLSRRIKGSQGRKRARVLVAKAHEKVASQRADFLHKVANYYIQSYGTIYVEGLNIKGMVRNHHLARHILDGAWGQFFGLLSYKAESAGRILVKVAPQNTSQLCSGCGIKVPKTLAERIHCCPNCGLVLDRDENAARNILSRGVGQTPQVLTWEVAPCVA
jgi:putative transposase